MADRRERTERRLQIERRAAATRRAKYGNEFFNKQATQRLIEKYKKSDTTRTCDVCGVQFCNLFGRQSWMAICSPECSRKKELRRKIRKEKVRRMRKRSIPVIEMVDPFEVFEQDGWFCQICGVDTPIELRGTTKPNAPELDHKMPLSRGGAHSWDNVQCACRKCNMAKRDRLPDETEFRVTP